MIRAVLFLFLLCPLLTCSKGTVPVAIGGPIPEFHLKDLKGASFKNKDLGNEVTILNFWATWCQPCRTEMPALNQIESDGDARVIGISLDEGGVPVVQAFLKKEPLKYTILMGNQDVFLRFKGLATPYTLVVSPKGEIVAIHSGPASLETLREDIAKAKKVG